MSSYYKQLPYSILTSSECNILYPYIDDDRDPWYTKYGGYNTGVNIECNNVYSVCFGHVIYICHNCPDDEDVVIVQYSSQVAFRYAHMKEIYVSINDYIYRGTQVGVADNYLHFEYLEYSKVSSWPVRVGQKQYYKHDPEDYVDGTIALVT